MLGLVEMIFGNLVYFHYLFIFKNRNYWHYPDWNYKSMMKSYKDFREVNVFW